MVKENINGSNLGFESELWRAADALRSNMESAEYKHVVLGLLFLKYISDAFEEQHVSLEADRTQGADPEDPDEYRAVNIFWVPKEARWSYLKANAKQPTIGKTIDDAMLAIERDDKSLKGVLPKDYAHILTPGRYVGAAEVEDDSEPFDEKMARWTTVLREQTEKAKKLDQIIWANLEDIGYGG